MLKDKLLEQKERFSETQFAQKLGETTARVNKELKKHTSSSTLKFPHHKDGLSKNELGEMFAALKIIIVHLRARIEVIKIEFPIVEEFKEKTKFFLTGPAAEEQVGGLVSGAQRTLMDARTIIAISQTGAKNLEQALKSFNPQTLAAVVKLVLQSSEAPLLNHDICGEIIFLFQKGVQTGTDIDVDDFRSALCKASPRNIDLLGQLVGLLAGDSNGPDRLSYMFGPLIFLPRFDTKNAVVNKEYEGINTNLRSSTMAIIGATKQMIIKIDDIFSLDDVHIIRRLANEIREPLKVVAPLSPVVVSKPVVSTPTYAVSSPNFQSVEAIPASPRGVAHAFSTLQNDGIRVSASPAVVEEQVVAAPVSLIEDEFCIVLYDFIAETELEVTANEGERITVLDKGQDGWWKIKNSAGQVGLVAANYVQVLGSLANHSYEEDDAACELQEDQNVIVVDVPSAEVDAPAEEFDEPVRGELEVIDSITPEAFDTESAPAANVETAVMIESKHFEAHVKPVEVVVVDPAQSELYAQLAAMKLELEREREERKRRDEEVARLQKEKEILASKLPGSEVLCAVSPIKQTTPTKPRTPSNRTVIVPMPSPVASKELSDMEKPGTAIEFTKMIPGLRSPVVVFAKNMTLEAALSLRMAKMLEEDRN